MQLWISIIQLWTVIELWISMITHERVQFHNWVINIHNYAYNYRSPLLIPDKKNELFIVQREQQYLQRAYIPSWLLYFYIQITLKMLQLYKLTHRLLHRKPIHSWNLHYSKESSPLNIASCSCGARLCASWHHGAALVPRLQDYLIRWRVWRGSRARKVESIAGWIWDLHKCKVCQSLDPGTSQKRRQPRYVPHGLHPAPRAKSTSQEWFILSLLGI